MNLQHCIDELLMCGADDWVHLPEVESVVDSTGEALTEDDLRELSLRLIRAVVEQGLMQIGDVTEKDRGFRKWDLPMEKALERVESEWRALKRELYTGDICWLCNTEKGNEIGNRLLDERKPSP